MMNANPACPACGHTEWNVLGQRTYRLEQTAHLSAYQRIRYEVLFNVWLPGAGEARFTSLLCIKCGFVAFSPRPTATDLEAKYAYLAAHPAARLEMTVSLPSDMERSHELFAYLVPHLKSHQKSLLDYGGGNGRLLGSFVNAGFACGVVDFIKEALPSIEHVGTTLDSVPEDRKFDVVVCSHVLEHLAEPRAVLARLATRLKIDGILYIEVPSEIWNDVPLPVEPVTHLNYFTPHSLDTVCRCAGLDVMSCKEGTYTTEEGVRALAIRAVTRRVSCEPAITRFPPDATKLTRRYVHPSLLARVARLARYPDLRRSAFQRFARAHLPRAFFWRFMD
jgi:2-polyprenyl-3-methyl-5-hydroxy-6-metoxy-1,4-benzoquinol methylase